MWTASRQQQMYGTLTIFNVKIPIFAQKNPIWLLEIPVFYYKNPFWLLQLVYYKNPTWLTKKSHFLSEQFYLFGGYCRWWRARIHLFIRAVTLIRRKLTNCAAGFASKPDRLVPMLVMQKSWFTSRAYLAGVVSSQSKNIQSTRCALGKLAVTQQLL